jgi:HEAT repeat protein/beta-lactamase regulating signal transducer with metallopeptidase domain
MTYLTFATSQLLTSGAEAALFLLDMALKATAIILAALALSFALRHASAATRHLLWSAALLSLLALPVLAYTLPDWRVAVLPESFSASEVSSIDEGSETIAHRETAVRQVATTKPIAPAQKYEVAAPAQPLQKAEAIAPAASQSFHWSRWVLLIWFAGFLISIGRLTLGIATVRRLSRTASEITDATWTALAENIGRQLDLPRRVALLKSSRIAMPQTWGMLSPVILLPADADDWLIERSRVVLMHELAHVKRKDCLTQVMAQTVCSLYWFNPLVWMAARRLRLERELACDDQVLEKGTRASDYADLLLDMARTLPSRRCSSLTTVAMARQSEFERRLLAILSPSLNRKGLNRLKASILVVALALVILPLASLRPTAQAKGSQRGEVTSFTLAEALGNQELTKIGNQTSHASITSPKSEPKSLIDEPAKEQPEEGTGEQEQANAVERASAACKLGMMGVSAAPAIPQLIRLLGDETSVGAFDCGTRGTVHSDDDTVGQEAAVALMRIGPLAIDPLALVLKTQRVPARKNAAFALALLKDDRTVEPLIAAITDSAGQVRAQAAWGLGQKHDSSAVEPLINALKDAEWEVREQAAWASGLVGNRDSVEPLSAALKDSHARVRSQAAWALGLKGNKDAVEPLMVALKDSDAHVRAEAAWALGLKGDYRAVEALSATTNDDNNHVRQQATWALGMIKLRDRRAANMNIKIEVDPNSIKKTVSRKFEFVTILRRPEKTG